MLLLGAHTRCLLGTLVVSAYGKQSSGKGLARYRVTRYLCPLWLRLRRSLGPCVLLYTRSAGLWGLVFYGMRALCFTVCALREPWGLVIHCMRAPPALGFDGVRALPAPAEDPGPLVLPSPSLVANNQQYRAVSLSLRRLSSFSNAIARRLPHPFNQAWCERMV